jgi:FkbM family methyltransferase
LIIDRSFRIVIILLSCLKGGDVLDRTNLNLINALSSFRRSFDISSSLKFGMPFTLKYALSIAGMNIYSVIEYPVSGIKVFVRPEISWKRLENGSIEHDCFRYMSTVVKKGNVILDIGAWKGTYTLFFSKLMQGTGRIYSFEPDPKAFHYLSANVSRNNLNNVRLERLCVTNTVGKIKLKSNDYGFGSSGTTVMEHAIGSFGEIMAESTTVDKFCQDDDICPQGLKIDVEGAEGLVIQGCQQVIKKYAPWILMEFHSEFMSEENRLLIWREIVGKARKVVFIEGKTDQYHYASEVDVDAMPTCPNFHVFIEY